VKNLELLIGVWCGSGMAFAVEGLHQDSFGSLDAYVAYLRNGHWVDGRLICWICLTVCAVAVLGIGIINVRQARNT
jgi:hypothetical protein